MRDDSSSEETPPVPIRSKDERLFFADAIEHESEPEFVVTAIPGPGSVKKAG